MFNQPQAEHRWLEQLVGSWDFSHVCQTPDGADHESHGKMTCRMLGGLWLIAESQGTTPSGEEWSSIMTVGYDPAEGVYIGTFVGSMMAHLWPYRGSLDGSGQRLPLESRGPKFMGEGTCSYRDTLVIVDARQWDMLSEFQDDQGRWQQFMTGRHVRSGQSG